MIGDFKAVVVGFLLDALLAEDGCHQPLQLGGDGVFAIAIAIELSATAEEGHDGCADGGDFPDRCTGQNVCHAVGNAARLIGHEERTFLTVACCGQHDVVVTEGCGSQCGCAMAQTGAGQGALLLEADGPVVGDVRELKFVGHEFGF